MSSSTSEPSTSTSPGISDAPGIPEAPTTDKRKQAYRFNAATDIALLKEIEHIQPYDAPHGQKAERWVEVSSRFNQACDFGGNKTATPKNCQNRFEELIKRFKQDEMDSLRASGTEEEFNEREQLLTDIIELMQEAIDSKADKKRKRDVDDDIRETNGSKIREAATNVLRNKAKNDSAASSVSKNDTSPTSSSATSSSRSKSSSGNLAQSVASIADVMKESAASDSAAIAAALAAASEDRKIRLKELELQERKMQLEEKRMELNILQLKAKDNN
ncbi:UNVERIFIED_CONTAM: hypothetical protein HDU68_001622 [Siphonaria sp. JEL0065]|nr:hypothetical protein HDU68_001622 [Siphonaria sp. JEL0065]